MRALWLIVGLGCASATPTLACDFHMGGLFDQNSAFTGYETPDDVQARQAALAAEREKTMDQARQAFLARFDIKPDEAPQQLAAASAPPPVLSTHADSSPRPVPQDR